MSATSNQREMILKWHKGKAATPEYTAKLLGLPLSEVLYVIEHPEPPKSRAARGHRNSSNHWSEKYR